MSRYLSARKIFLQRRCPYCGSPPPAFTTRVDGKRKLFSCGACTVEFGSPHAWFDCTHADRYKDESPKPRYPPWKKCYESLNTGEVIVFDRPQSLDDGVPLKVGEMARYTDFGPPDQHGVCLSRGPATARVVKAEYAQMFSSGHYQWVYELEGVESPVYVHSATVELPIYQQVYESEKELLAAYPFPILVRHTESEWQAIQDAEHEADRAKRPEFHKAMDHFCNVLIPAVRARLEGMCDNSK